MTKEIEKIWELFVTSNGILEVKRPLKSRKVVPQKEDYCEPKLDLHGYTEDQAYDEIKRYLMRAKKCNLKRVIIITGKGYTNPLLGEFRKGVLRSKFPSWMEYSELSMLVKSYKQADIRDGGDGAFYVFL